MRGVGDDDLHTSNAEMPRLSYIVGLYSTGNPRCAGSDDGFACTNDERKLWCQWGWISHHCECKPKDYDFKHDEQNSYISAIDCTPWRNKSLRKTSTNICAWTHTNFQTRAARADVSGSRVGNFWFRHSLPVALKYGWLRSSVCSFLGNNGQPCHFLATDVANISRYHSVFYY